MTRAFIKARSIVTTAVLAVAVSAAVLLVGVRVVGLVPYAVLSGSMEPEYPVGSLLYVKRVDVSELKVGDDITFLLDSDTAATHRIVAVVPDEDDPSVLRFKTKGIANRDEDGGLVHARNVIGKPIFDIPYLGYFSVYIQKPPGLYIVIAVAVILLAVGFWPDFRGKRKTENRCCSES